MQTTQAFFLYVGLFICLSCQKEENLEVDFVDPNLTWLIPKEDIFDPGLGKDGIPSIDEPQFSPPSEFDSFFDDRLIVGIAHEGEVRGYPMDMLNWHEIVNDDVKGLEVAITYCPLTGTGIGWSRRIDGFLTSFGVSGFLYNSNLMPYDRRTNSTWSQQRMECVNGRKIGDVPQSYTLIETNFATWRKSFPNSKVMNANTGFDRRYVEYPYGFYLQDDDLFFFPVDRLDDRLPNKERVLGVLENGMAKAYPFYVGEPGRRLIRDRVGGTEIIVIQSQTENFNLAFVPTVDRRYEAIPSGFPGVMKDDMENEYDIAGRVVMGPNVGESLVKPVSFMGYWFSWVNFYPDIEIYDE